MAHIKNIPDYPDEIFSLSEFHPEICYRQQAESYVIQHSQGQGSYIVRPNTENDPSYVSLTISISVNDVCNAKVYIEKTDGGIKYYISDKQKFSTFKALLTFYYKHSIHCRQGIENLRLLIPLGKINQPLQKRSSQGSLGKDHRMSGSSSSSDDIPKGLKQPMRENLDTRPKVRTVSEPQTPVGQNVFSGSSKHGGSLKDHGTTKRPNSTFTRSKSESNSDDFLQSKDFGRNYPGYTNSILTKQDPKSLMNCRPPAPLPRPTVSSSDDSYYYTIIEANKDFFQETYQFLKDSEQCECGLRLADSQLALGWTIHRSQDPATLNHIFFQYGERTSWEMPVDLVYQLTTKQVNYIICLCREGKQSLPVSLRERLDREKGRIVNEKRRY